MIKLTRIDDRLLHGQVAFTWTPALGVDCILVANDKVAGDEFQKMALGLAKPPGAKLLIKPITGAISFLNDPKNTHQKILVIINSIHDAHALCKEVSEIRSVNFGGIRNKEGARSISKSVSVTDAEVSLIREMLDKGLELEVRQVPTESRQMLKNLI